jgi:hypothetical protein
MRLAALRLSKFRQRGAEATDPERLFAQVLISALKGQLHCPISPSLTDVVGKGKFFVQPRLILK